MPPSPRWFPAALVDRAAWYSNFNTQFAVLSESLGFLPADVTQVEKDNMTIQMLATWSVSEDSYARGVSAFRKEILEGDIGNAPPAAPIAPDPVLAGISAPGLFERLDDLVARIRVSPTYSEEEGAMLGIIPSKSERIPNDDLKPVITAKAMPNNIVEVKFTRGKTDGVQIFIVTDNEGSWTDAGKFFKSPAALIIPASVNDLPRSVNIRARYVVGNDAVGQWSDTINVSTVP